MIKNSKCDLIQNFSLPDFEAGGSCVCQHVVVVHVDDLAKVRQLEGNNLKEEIKLTSTKKWKVKYISKVRRRDWIKGVILESTKKLLGKHRIEI
jgi:hypothetical protein